MDAQHQAAPIRRKISYGIYLWHFPLMHLGGVVLGLMMTAVAAPISYRYL